MTGTYASRSVKLTAAVFIAMLGCSGVFMLFGHLLPAQPPSQSQVGYRLVHASAADVIPRLRAVLPRGKGQVHLAVDQTSNRVLVKAPGNTQKLAAELVAALDQPQAKPSRGRQTPEAPIVKAYSVASQRLQPLAAALQRRYPASTGVRVVPDARTGQLLVVAPPDVQRAVAQQIVLDDAGAASKPPAQAAKPPATVAPDNALDQVRLQHITWPQLEAGLREFLGRAPTIRSSGDGQQLIITLPTQASRKVQLHVDRNNGVAIINGPTKPVKAWLEVIRALDTPRPSPDYATKLMSLRNANRTSVRHALSLLASGGQAAGGSPGIVTEVDAAEDGPRNGRQLISRLFQTKQPASSEETTGDQAPQSPTAGAAGQPAAGGEGTATGEGAEGAATGEAGLPTGGGGLIGQVQVEYLEGSDVIVIRGHQRDVQRVVEIINQIEKLSRETEPEVKILPLQYVDSRSMETLITELYEEVYSTRQGAVSITALGKPNALLLIGRTDSVQVVVKLVEQLDQPVDPKTQFHVIRLEHIAAGEAQTMIREFFDDASQPNEESDRGGLGTKVRVTADTRSNSLIIQASARDLAEVRRLIKQIDVSTSKVTSRVEVFQLRNSRAEELAPILQQAISGAQGQATGQGGGPLPGQVVPTDQGAGGRAGQTTQGRSAMLTFTVLDPEGQRVLRSGIMRDVQINADPSTNSLIITAPESAMELISALIKRLDQLPSSDAVIKVFTLANGDASSVRDMLEEMFAPPTNQQQQQLPFQTAAAPGETSLVPLRFSVDVRTNSIIATGTPADLAIVRAIILKLDGDDVRQRQNLVYHLRYTQAVDVAQAIQDFLRAEQQRTQQQIQQFVQGQQQGLSPFEQIEREVVVVAESLSNSLIISATPRFYEQIVDIITEIDTIPPMVMIQVLIAEVGRSQDEQFGVEWGVQDSILFDRPSVLGTPGLISQGVPGPVDVATGLVGAASGITTNNIAGLGNVGSNTVGTQGLTDLALGRQDSTLGYGGFVFAAGSESVNILIRALQQRTCVNLLARPQIMTLDNQSARVQVGQDVRIASGTSITQNGFTNITTEPRSIGIILDVLPRISPDGTVTMLISAERSRLGPDDEGTPIGVDQFGQPVLSPRVELITALTTISVRSGQTAVFGGLITKDDTIISHAVPILSDIPILGAAFRYDSDEVKKTELLIILTPHVIQSAEDIERINAIESSRMSWCLADVIRIHGDPGLAGSQSVWHGSDIKTEYPDGQPVLEELLPKEQQEKAESGPTIRMPKLPNKNLLSVFKRFTRRGSNDDDQPRGAEPEPAEAGPSDSVASTANLSYGPVGPLPAAAEPGPADADSPRPLQRTSAERPVQHVARLPDVP